MKFNVPSKTLYNCVSAVSKIINARNALTILNNFKLELEGDTLKVTAADGENFLEGRISVTDSSGEGAVCVDARRLVELLKELPDVGISVEVDPERSFEMSINYANGEFKFMGFDGVEFPEADEAGQGDERFSFVADSSKLIRGVDNTLFAVGNDELRPQMMGILWDIKEDQAVFVATDTRKLVRFADKSIAAGVSGSFILPLKSAVVMKNVFSKESDVKVTVREKGVVFESLSFTFNSRFLKGRFPDYERVIPRSNPYTMTVDRGAFQSAVRRIGSFGNSDNGLIRFKIEPSRLILKACENGYNASAWESVPCDFNGTEMVIGFSGPYVSEILATIGYNDVVVHLSDPSRPGVFEPLENQEDTELLMILMPMLVADF